MTHIFKAGDRVRRTVFCNYGYNPDFHGKPGVIYTLTGCAHNAISGDGDDGSKLHLASLKSGKFELVVPEPPTNDLIIAEAERRWTEGTNGGMSIADYVIEIVRSGWAPTLVPADLLAARKYAAARYPRQADRYNSGQCDNGTVKTFVAGAAWRKANPTA